MRLSVFLFVFLFSRHSSGFIILPNSTDELTYTKGGIVNITCINDRPIEWIYPSDEPEEEDDFISTKNITTTQVGQLYKSELLVLNASYMDTGYYQCLSKVDGANVYDEKKIYVYIQDDDHPLAVNSSIYFLTVNEFGDIVIPCRPTSPNVHVQLYTTNGEELSNSTFDGINITFHPHRGYNLKGVDRHKNRPVQCCVQEECVIVYPRNDPSFVFDRRIGFTKKSPTVQDSQLVTCEVNGSSYFKEFQLHITPQSRISRPHIDGNSPDYPVEGQNVNLHCLVTVSHGDVVLINWKYPDDKVKNKVISHDQMEIRNEKDQVVQNKKSITITNVTKTDSGEYTCEVSNLNGSSETTTFSLTVNSPDTSFLNMNLQGNNTEWIVDAGASTFQWIVNVAAFPRPTIFWYGPLGNEIQLGVSSNGKYMASFDGRTTKLVINKININDTGEYKVVADNEKHRKHLSPILLVKDSPSVTIRVPEKLPVYLVNDMYSAECTAVAYPLSTVRWYMQECNQFPSCGSSPFTKVPANYFSEIAIFRHIIMSKLKINATRSLILRCEAENGLGSSNLLTNLLVTDVQNGYSLSFSDDVITVGDDINLDCGASKYLYKDRVEWFYINQKSNSSNLIPVNKIAGVQIMKNKTEFSYHVRVRITEVQKNFTGLYVCHAILLSDENVLMTRNIFVDVKDVEKPELNHTNMNGTVFRTRTNKQVKFECHVRGVPTPVIAWYKDKVPIQLPNNTRIALYKSNQSLVIEYAGLTDAGVYSCVASNKGGNISVSESLDFSDKPEEHEHLMMYLIFAIGTLFCAFCIFWLAIRIQRERKLRKELAENGLLNFEEGAVSSLNPDLGIEDQADLLPYDRRWEFPQEKLKFGKQLGSGAFGVVMKAEADGIIDENTTTTVAVKMVKRSSDALHIRALASELKIMIHLGRHLNVVNLLGACTRNIYKRELCVIVEYCKYGNLHDFLLKQRNNFVNQINEEGQLDFSTTTNTNSRYTAMINNAFTSSPCTTTTDVSLTIEDTPIGSDGYLISKDSEPDWRSNYRGDYRNTMIRPIKTSDLICWSFQIARGMEYLASRKVLHGDLAARNVVLADENIVKICDFGLAKSMYNNENYQRKRNELLPIKWMAVESLRDRVFSIQSDVWSFGITMWELFSLAVTPYPGVRLETLYAKLDVGYRLEQPTYATKELYKVMTDCWHERPTLRPTFTELTIRLGDLLEEGVRSHYSNLDGMYLKMNENMNVQVDYLALMNPPNYTNALEEPRYVNVPLRNPRDSPESDEDIVELKPMLPSTGHGLDSVTVISFSNPSYTPLTRVK